MSIGGRRRRRGKNVGGTGGGVVGTGAGVGEAVGGRHVVIAQKADNNSRIPRV